MYGMLNSSSKMHSATWDFVHKLLQTRVLYGVIFFQVRISSPSVT
jgi:hypothetical protein